MICAASRQLLDVRREEDAGDVLFMGIEVCYRDQLCSVKVLDKVPHEDVTLRSRLTQALGK